MTRRGSHDDEAGQLTGANSSSSGSLTTAAADPTFNGFVSENMIRGIGVIARIITEKTGIVWWLKSKNNFQSVWFEASKTFLYGANLADKNLYEVFKEGN